MAIEPQKPKNSEQSLLISYLFLRKSVGVLGFSLPIIMVIGSMILGDCRDIQGSISDYYHTVMRDFFVGLLCAIALFLFSYKGYDRRDNIAGTLGCVFALGVALFPTSLDDSSCNLPNSILFKPIISTLHFIFATSFFLVLTYFSLFLFTESSKKKMTKQKKQRNTVYIVCGYVMFVCIVMIAVYFFFLEKRYPQLKPFNPVFWLEAFALWAFAVSWLIKGELLLKDE